MKVYYCFGKKDFCDRDFENDCGDCEYFDDSGGEEREFESMTELDILASDINEHCADLSENYCGNTNCTSCLANALYNAGYRKERQGECEYCKTGDEKCGTCAYFIGIDGNDALDRCSEYYGEDKCVKYKPASHCFNCGAKMKGAE